MAAVNFIRKSRLTRSKDCSAIDRVYWLRL